MDDKILDTLSPFVEGNCHFMCPEKERKLREREGLLHVLEVERGTERSRLPTADPSRVVKCFARSAAGRERQSASDLRPPRVLRQTLRYLLHDVVADARYDWLVVYEFVSDRLRAIRQDMIIQGVCPRETIDLLQPMVRFYAYAGYRLCEEPVARFDPQINRTHLQECLKGLLSLYDEEDARSSAGLDAVCRRMARLRTRDARAEPGGRSSGEQNVPDTGQCVRTLPRARADMEALYLALNLGSPAAITRSLDLRLHKRDALLGVVSKMSLSHWLGHYVHVYRGLAELPALVSCVAVLHLPAVRRQTLQVMSVAFSSRNLRYPLRNLKSLLLYSSEEEAANDCRRYRLVVEGDSVTFDKKAFDVTASPSPSQHEPFVQQALCKCDLPELLLGT